MENTKKSLTARNARLAEMRKMRYEDGATLDEIGIAVGNKYDGKPLSRERVRQILGNRGLDYRFRRLCGLLRKAAPEDWKGIIKANKYSPQIIYKARKVLMQ